MTFLSCAIYRIVRQLAAHLPTSREAEIFAFPPELACAMAAAAASQLFGGSLSQIEYAAEMGLEHHLGMTCDPVCGLVQIPCIERNAVAAMRAKDAVSLSSLLWNTRKISFDSIVKTMAETGKDLLPSYRETAEGGLAKTYRGDSE